MTVYLIKMHDGLLMDESDEESESDSNSFMKPSGEFLNLSNNNMLKCYYGSLKGNHHHYDTWGDLKKELKGYCKLFNFSSDKKSSNHGCNNELPDEISSLIDTTHETYEILENLTEYNYEIIRNQVNEFYASDYCKYLDLMMSIGVFKNINFSKAKLYDRIVKGFTFPEFAMLSIRSYTKNAENINDMLYQSRQFFLNSINEPNVHHFISVMPERAFYYYLEEFNHEIFLNDDLDSFIEIASEVNFDLDNDLKIENYYTFDEVGRSKNERKMKFTYIDKASKYGSIKIFKYLLTMGAKIDFFTARYAVEAGNIEIVRILEQKNIINTENIFCLAMSAVSFHRHDILIWLLEKMYDISVKQINLLKINSIFSHNIKAFLHLMKFDEFSVNQSDLLYSILTQCYTLFKLILHLLNSKACIGSYIFSITFDNYQMAKDISNILEIKENISFIIRAVICYGDHIENYLENDTIKAYIDEYSKESDEINIPYPYTGGIFKTAFLDKLKKCNINASRICFKIELKDEYVGRTQSKFPNYSLLDFAIYTGNLKWCNDLICDPNYDMNLKCAHPFHESIRIDNEQLIKLFLQQPHIKYPKDNILGTTLYDLAFNYGSKKVIKLLYDEGIITKHDVFHYIEHNYISIEAIKEIFYPILKNDVDTDGCSLLAKAVIKGDLDYWYNPNTMEFLNNMKYINENHIEIKDARMPFRKNHDDFEKISLIDGISFKDLCVSHIIKILKKNIPFFEKLLQLSDFDFGISIDTEYKMFDLIFIQIKSIKIVQMVIEHPNLKAEDTFEMFIKLCQVNLLLIIDMFQKRFHSEYLQSTTIKSAFNIMIRSTKEEVVRRLDKWNYYFEDNMVIYALWAEICYLKFIMPKIPRTEHEYIILSRIKRTIDNDEIINEDLLNFDYVNYNNLDIVRLVCEKSQFKENLEIIRKFELIDPNITFDKINAIQAATLNNEVEKIIELLKFEKINLKIYTNGSQTLLKIAKSNSNKIIYKLIVDKLKNQKKGMSRKK